MSHVPHGSTPKTRPTESGPAAADRHLFTDEPDNTAATDPCGATAPFDDPNAARVWNYFTGGSLNSSVDRELARRLAAVFPAHPLTQAGWDFQRRVITDLFGRGIRQFLDLGSGLLSHHGVRELAEAFDFEVRVVYVDVDPVVVQATTIRLVDTTGTVAIRADLRDPATLLAHADLRAVLDVELPAAVLAFSVLDTLPDTDHPGDCVTALVGTFAPGSYLAVSHLTADTAAPDLRAQLDAAIALFAETGTTIVPRDAATVASWLSGLDVLDPGVCLAAHWRPDHPVSPEPHQQLLLGAVARTLARTDHPSAALDSPHRVTELPLDEQDLTLMNSAPTLVQRALANQALLRTATGVTVIIAALAVVIVPVILLRAEPAWIPLLVFRIETWHAVISCTAAVALLQQKTWARIALVVLGAVCAPGAVLSLLWLNWPAFATTGVFALAAVASYKLELPQSRSSSSQS